MDVIYVHIMEIGRKDRRRKGRKEGKIKEAQERSKEGRKKGKIKRRKKARKQGKEGNCQ